MHAHKPQDRGFFGPREHLRGYAAGIVHAHIQAAHLPQFSAGDSLACQGKRRIYPVVQITHHTHAVLLRRLYNGVHVLTAGRKRLFYQNMLSRTGSIHRHLSVQMIRRRH